MGTEQPRKTDTRQALLDAALHVFLRHGFARATTREIAQTAGVAEGTIYRHFADKYALFHEVFLSLTVEVLAEVRRFRERAGKGTVRGNLETLFAMVGGIQEQLSSLMASMWADPELAKNIGARAGRWPPRASYRPVRGDGRRVHPGGAGAGPDQAPVSTRRRPRRSWSRCRSRPGWSARSVPPRRDRRVPPTDKPPDPGGRRSRHPGSGSCTSDAGR